MTKRDLHFNDDEFCFDDLDWSEMECESIDVNDLFNDDGFLLFDGELIFLDREPSSQELREYVEAAR